MTDTRGFLERLRLATAGPDRLRGNAGDGAERIQRGLLAAQVMIAAGATTDTAWRWVHSLHLTHVADGDPRRDVEYRVERLSDTAHATTRLVHAVQAGDDGEAVLATATVAFQTARRGIGPMHQEDGPGELPDPHALAPHTHDGTGVPVEVRYLDRVPWEPAAAPAAANRMWVRFTEEIPDEILLHSAAVVFAADLLLVEPVVPPEPGATREWTDLDSGRPLEAVVLDLSVRFHRSFRADDWLLHAHRSPSIAQHRAYTTGEFFSSMGRLVASVSQETALVPVGDRTAHQEAAGVTSGARR